MTTCLRMAAQSQVVVGTEIEDGFGRLCHSDEDSLTTLDNSLILVRAGCLQFFFGNFRQLLYNEMMRLIVRDRGGKKSRKK